MAKKSARKPRGAASIEVVGEDIDHDVIDLNHESNGSQPDSQANRSKPKRAAKPKTDPTAGGNFAISDIKKAAAFANSIGGLDKAIAVLQILKVAKEVQ
jgi:hypothetical protein